MPRVHVTTVFLVIVFVAQVALAFMTRAVQPFWTVLPPVPTERSLDAQAFGDREFLYRLLVLDLQNFGDTGGHLTRMGDYDMAGVVGWLKALDYLDKDADHHLKLATQYFVYSTKIPQLELLVHYVQGQVATSPARHWRWLFEAIYIAQAKLHNMALATAVADQLSSYDFPDTILIARQIGAVMHAKMGDYDQAGDMMQKILESQAGHLTEEDTAEMKNFIAEVRAKAAKARGE